MTEELEAHAELCLADVEDAPSPIRKRYSITRQFGLMPVIGGLAAQPKRATIPPIETADELLGDLLRGYDVIDG